MTYERFSGFIYQTIEKFIFQLDKTLVMTSYLWNT